jgi:hypothetical protein
MKALSRLGELWSLVRADRRHTWVWLDHDGYVAGVVPGNQAVGQVFLNHVGRHAYQLADFPYGVALLDAWQGGDASQPELTPLSGDRLVLGRVWSLGKGHRGLKVVGRFRDVVLDEILSSYDLPGTMAVFFASHGRALWAGRTARRHLADWEGAPVNAYLSVLGLPAVPTGFVQRRLEATSARRTRAVCRRPDGTMGPAECHWLPIDVEQVRIGLLHTVAYCPDFHMESTSCT